MRSTRWMMATCAVVLASMGLAGQAHAQAARCHNGASFAGWLEAFKQEAATKGISRSTLAAAGPYLSFSQDIVRKDRGQGVFQQSFLEFANRMAGSRQGNGMARLKQNAALIARIEQKYGVPGPVFTAFWGLETDFGANNGNLPVLRSLATLAYDCRRADYFREELMYALKVAQRGDLEPSEMVGAWAGEIGQTQFSPKAYFKYAEDFDGDGKRDLIGSVPDVLASSANMIAQSGWKRGEPWLQEVRVPREMDWQEADLAIKHPRAQWARWGVTLPGGRALSADEMPAALLLPMGRGGPAFLAYNNFYAFLEWNQSLVYATTAAYYATRLSGAPAVFRGNSPGPTPSAAQISELQRLLTRQGYEAGKVDGKLGTTTRSAVKKAQIKFGMPADSYPTAKLIARLRGSA